MAYRRLPDGRTRTIPGGSVRTLPFGSTTLDLGISVKAKVRSGVMRAVTPAVRGGVQ